MGQPLSAGINEMPGAGRRSGGKRQLRAALPGGWANEGDGRRQQQHPVPTALPAAAISIGRPPGAAAFRAPRAAAAT